jgi:hypothetical protein
VAGGQQQEDIALTSRQSWWGRRVRHAGGDGQRRDGLRNGLVEGERGASVPDGLGGLT